VRNQVQILAHRGLVSEKVPENTIKAFEDALACGADVLETDIQCSKDGVAIIFHDDDFLRMAGLASKVNDLNWSEIMQIDIGFGNRVPSLEQALTEFPSARFNLDVKSNAAIRATADVINKSRAQDRVLVSSFSESRRRKAVRAVSGKIPTSAGISRVLAIYIASLIGFNWLVHNLSKNITALQLPVQKSFLKFDSPRFISSVKKSNLQLHYWTINDFIEMKRLIRAGADGIVTDYCDAAILNLESNI